MDSVSTLTSKGLYYIPSKLRKKAGFKPKDRISARVEGDKLILQRVPSIKEAYGMLKNSIKLTPGQEEKAIEEGFIEDYLKSIKDQ